MSTSSTAAMTASYRKPRKATTTPKKLCPPPPGSGSCDGFGECALSSCGSYGATQLASVLVNHGGEDISLFSTNTYRTCPYCWRLSQ